MSTQFGLPSELAAFEAELRQQTPQSNEVNRDELMYQAGWAAAEVARKLRWSWPATSGVLAASVAVLAFLLVRSGEPVRVVEPSLKQVEPIVAETLPNLVEAQEQPVRIAPVRIVPARHWQADFSALARRHQIKDWDSLDIGATDEVGDGTLSEVKTVRSLLREFLRETGWGEAVEVKKQGNHGQLFEGRELL